MQVKRYEYYTYNGAYDPETHEVNCGGDNSCNVPVLGLNGQFELGKFIGAHITPTTFVENHAATRLRTRATFRGRSRLPFGR